MRVWDLNKDFRISDAAVASGNIDYILHIVSVGGWRGKEQKASSAPLMIIDFAAETENDATLCLWSAALAMIILKWNKKPLIIFCTMSHCLNHVFWTGRDGDDRYFASPSHARLCTIRRLPNSDPLQVAFKAPQCPPGARRITVTPSLVTHEENSRLRVPAKVWKHVGEEVADSLMYGEEGVSTERQHTPKQNLKQQLQPHFLSLFGVAVVLMRN